MAFAAGLPGNDGLHGAGLHSGGSHGEGPSVLGQLLVGQDAASEQFHPEPFTLQFQNVCSEPQGSGSSHYHSHHQFLQEGTVTPKGFFPFSAEVPPPQAWPKTIWPEAVHFSIAK